MKPALPFRLFVPHSRTYLIALCIGGCLQILMGPSSMVAQKKAQTQVFGLLAHWPFDENYASSVNNDLYEGRPVGELFTSIHKDKQVAKVGAGALRLDSGRASGQKTFVAVRNPLFGVRNSDVMPSSPGIGTSLVTMGRTHALLSGSPHRGIPSPLG